MTTSYKPPLFLELIKTHFYVYTIFVAVISGFIQGLAWAGMSLIGIVWHLSNPQDLKLVYGNDTYTKLLDTYLYYSFIKSDSSDTSMYIQPTQFFGTMFGYFFLNIIWMISSAFIYLESRRNFDRKARVLAIFNLWLAAAILILLLDFIICLILGLDYRKILDAYDHEERLVVKLAFSFMATSYGIMMVLAAKGFVLWIINLTVTAIMIKVFLYLKNNSLTNDDPDEFCCIADTSTKHISNLPEEVRNRDIVSEVGLRRRTEPTLSQNDVLSSSSSFAPFKANVNYAYDPYVESRLAKYEVTPKSTLHGTKP